MLHTPLLVAGAFALATLVMSCASRDVPARYPKSSPASLDAAAGPRVQVTTSLRASAAPSRQTNPPDNPQGHHAHH